MTHYLDTSAFVAWFDPHILYCLPILTKNVRKTSIDTAYLPYDVVEMNNAMKALEKELETFQRELPNLLANEGKFAVVADDRIVGIYTSYEDALTIGYEKCGLRPFLVKEIRAIEEVRFLSRDLTFPCPT